MKFFAAIFLLACVAVACAGKLPLDETDKLQPEAHAEEESKVADPRDKRSLIYGYASPYAAAYAYPYAATYSYPYAYAAPVAYSAAYYPSYYSSYYLG